MNKLGTKLGAVAMSAVMALSFAPSAAITSLAAGSDDVAKTAAADPGQAIYGLYNPNSGEHLFTANATEAAGLQVAGWQEGDVKWYSPTSGTKVYRLYNPNVFAPDGTPLGDHHYTTDEKEVANLKKAGWSEDAEFFYAQTKPGEGSVPVYKLYNPNAYTQPKYSGAHHFTLDVTEKDNLLKAGWGEGDVAFYTLGKEKPVVEELTVSIDNTTPKVGDTLTAEVVDLNGKDVSDNVTFQWYADDKAIEGETKDTLKVTEAMIGSALKVVVTAENGNEFASAATAAVYDALALLSADQTGKSVVTLTTNGPVSALDDIDVFKGTTEVEIDSIDYEDDGAKVTLKNAIVAGATYTVTLTPAEDEATSATFVGEKAQLKEIRFLNNNLVMKDTNYNEGYAYVKGVDQFDGEVNLSGLTVTPGVGEFKSYDTNTGKITIVDPNYNATSAGAFMLIKEVPVFVQYQQGSDVLTASATLEVSTRAYATEVEFGDIDKDGTKREDGKLTVTELASNKYYIPLTTVKDQYGNDLDADDLNDQLEDHVLFVIPGDTGAFYTTAGFGTVKVDGEDIVVLWLASAADPKPGTMALTLTGASGKSFTKDVTVEDDPYINTLSVTYPELYAGAAESNQVEFTAVDQYDNEINLWDFAPDSYGDRLVFTDTNNMTNVHTSITASGGATFNIVAKDTVKKTFKVTVDSSLLKAKNVVVFTTTTAGTKVATASVTVGERGTSAKIKSALKDTNTQLDPDSKTSYNFNANLQFEDANGNAMVRGVSEDYPYYISSVDKALPLGSKVKVSDMTDFGWTLSEKKPTENAGVVGVNDTGVISYSDVISAGGKADYYVGLYGTPDFGTTWYLLNTASFHMTAVTGTPKSYAVSVSGPMYTDAVETTAAKAVNKASITVKTTTDKNETYNLSADKISLVADTKFAVSKNTIAPIANKVYNIPKDGEIDVPVTVYVGTKDIDTVNVKLTNKVPVATGVTYNYATSDTGSSLYYASRVGAAISGGMYSDDFRTYAGATLTFDGGVLTITDVADLADTVTGKITDQYGQTMGNTELFINGKSATDGQVLTAGTRYTIQYVNGSKSQKFVLTPYGNITCSINVGGAGASYVVKTASEFRKALDAAQADSLTNIITVADSFSASGDFEIPENDIVVVKNGKTLKLRSTSVDVNGGLVTEGNGNIDDTAAAITVGSKGWIQFSGTSANTIKGDVTNNGTIYLDSTGAQKFSGELTNEGVITTLKYRDSGEKYAEASRTIGTDTIATEVEIDGTYTAEAGTIVGNGKDEWTVSNATAATNGTNLTTLLAGLAGAEDETNATETTVMLGANATPADALTVPVDVVLQDSDGTTGYVLTVPANKAITNNGTIKLGHKTSATAPLTGTGYSFVSGDGAEWTIGANVTAANTDEWFDGIMGGTIGGALTVNVDAATTSASTTGFTFAEDTTINVGANLTLAGTKNTNNGVINVTAGAFKPAGVDFVNNGTIDGAIATGAITGTFTNSETGYIEGSAALTLTGTAKTVLGGHVTVGTLTPAGTVDITGVLDADKIVNAAATILNFSGSSKIAGDSGANTAAITGAGLTVNVTAGTHEWGAVDILGALNVKGGTVELTDAGTTEAYDTVAATTVEAGTLVIAGKIASAAADSKITMKGGTLDLSGATLKTSGTQVTFNGSAEVIIPTAVTATGDNLVIKTTQASDVITYSGGNLAAGTTSDATKTTCTFAATVAAGTGTTWAAPAWTA